MSAHYRPSHFEIVEGGLGALLRGRPFRLEVPRHLTVPSRVRGHYARFGKRLLDILLVVVSMPLVVPVVAALAIAVALDSGRPFYSQERLGLGGRRFRMWKLRSMVPDAERKLNEWLERDPEMRAEWETRQKLRHDPRVTRLGRIMRKTSLDELPQLWNVLTGEMSIVGPRPMLPEQQSLYRGRAYFAMRPGLTCFWQISERNTSDFAQRAERDTEHAEAISLATDLKVIGRTAITVLRATGC